MKYILDTNMCIYLIKKKPVNVLKRFETLSIGDVCISSVTFAELMYGVKKSQFWEKNQVALENFVLPLDIMPFDDAAARCYGLIRADLEKSGTPIGALDLIIAAHAQALNFTLVTNNIKEFSRVKALKIENWIEMNPD